MNRHDVIDGFVRVVSSVGVPVVAVKAAPWVEQFEHKLPARLPPSFRSLVARYSFPSFEVGTLALFANNGDGGYDELANAVFRDKVMADVTHKAGYIQFARPADGGYDPICFDTGGSSKNREFPIVRLEHEAILVNSRIVVREVIAKSFLEFAQAVVALEKDQYGKVISVIEQTDF
ncbi:MAG TPA: SMI1/KNR4 family protein [Pyrinomonadaceae bacterium]|jgi:hypothetical protein|nr:SMI1/KNR4 family protein [Pyrinomonadaceae bacterium]